MKRLKKKSIYSKLSDARPFFIDKLRTLLDLITDNQMKYAGISNDVDLEKDYNDVIECIDYVNHVGAPTSSDAERMNDIWRKHKQYRENYSATRCYFSNNLLY